MGMSSHYMAGSPWSWDHEAEAVLQLQVTLWCQVYSSSASANSEAQGQISVRGSRVPARLVVYDSSCATAFFLMLLPWFVTITVFRDAFPHLQPAEEILPERSMLFFPSPPPKGAGVRGQLCKAEPWHFPQRDRLHTRRNTCPSLAAWRSKVSACSPWVLL